MVTGSEILRKILAYKQRDGGNDVIACFGKLPFFRDYIKYQLIYDSHFYWQQWLRDGYDDLQAYYGKTLNQVFPRMPAWHMMMIDDRESYLTLGTLAAGCDKMARCFPFSIFRKINAPAARRYLNMMPLIYKELLAAEKVLCLEGWELKNKRQFYESLSTLRKYNVSLRQENIAALQNNILNIINLGVMQRGLLAQHGIDDFAKFLTQVDVSLKSFSLDIDAEKHCGICIPLPSSHLNSSFVVFWLSLVNKHLKRSQKKLWVFWNHAYLMVYSPRMLPSYFRHLIEPQVNHDGLVNVLNPLENVNAASPMTDLAQQTNLSLLDVLAYWI